MSRACTRQAAAQLARRSGACVACTALHFRAAFIGKTRATRTSCTSTTCRVPHCSDRGASAGSPIAGSTASLRGMCRPWCEGGSDRGRAAREECALRCIRRDGSRVPPATGVRRLPLRTGVAWGEALEGPPHGLLNPVLCGVSSAFNVTCHLHFSPRGGGVPLPNTGGAAQTRPERRARGPVTDRTRTGRLTARVGREGTVTRQPHHTLRAPHDNAQEPK